MVQHVGNRHIVAGPSPDDITIGTRCIYNMLAVNITIFSEHAPFAIWQQFNVAHLGTPINFGTQFARPRRHGIGNVSRCDMAIGDRPECGFDAECFEIGMVLFDLRRTNNFSFIVCKF